MLKINHFSTNETTRRLCEGYWAMNSRGVFEETAKHFAASNKISINKLRSIAVNNSTLSAPWLKCQGCEKMATISSRSELLRSIENPPWICSSCLPTINSKLELSQYQLETKARKDAREGLREKQDNFLDRLHPLSTHSLELPDLLDLGAFILFYGDKLREPFPFIEKNNEKLLSSCVDSSKDLFNRILNLNIIAIISKSDFSSIKEIHPSSFSKDGSNLIPYPFKLMPISKPFTSNQIIYDPSKMLYEITCSKGKLRRLARKVANQLERHLKEPEGIEKINSLLALTAEKECNAYLTDLLHKSEIHDLCCYKNKKAVKQILNKHSLASAKSFIFKVISLAKENYLTKGTIPYASHQSISNNLIQMANLSPIAFDKMELPSEINDNLSKLGVAPLSALSELCLLLLHCFSGLSARP